MCKGYVEDEEWRFCFEFQAWILSVLSEHDAGYNRV